MRYNRPPVWRNPCVFPFRHIIGGKEDIQFAALQHGYRIGPGAVDVLIGPVVDLGQFIEIVYTIACRVAVFIQAKQVIDPAGNPDGPCLFLRRLGIRGRNGTEPKSYCRQQNDRVLYVRFYYLFHVSFPLRLKYI